MLPSINTINHEEMFEDIGTIRDHIARATIGSTVDLLVGTQTVIHGVVTGVFSDAGTPKIVVGGMLYDPKQILTVAPPRLY
jgi:hypothetical protein